MKMFPYITNKWILSTYIHLHPVQPRWRILKLQSVADGTVPYSQLTGASAVADGTTVQIW